MGGAVAESLLPMIFSSMFGADTPEYTQPTPEQVMTPVQRAMQTPLQKIGEMGYEQGMKYMDPELFKKNSAFYDRMKGSLQTGANIGGAVKAPEQPAATTTTAAPASTFTPNEDLDKGLKLWDYLKQDRSGGNILNADPETIRMSHDVTNPITKALAQATITPQMLDAYRRQKAQYADAELLKKFQGVK